MSGGWGSAGGGENPVVSPIPTEKTKGVTLTTKNSVTKAARIREEDWNRLEGYVGDRTFGDFIHEIAQDIEIYGNIGELRGMCNFYGITFDRLISGVLEKVDNGEITIEDGKIVLNG